MKNKKTLALSTLFVAMSGLYGCSEGDKSDVNITVDGSGGGDIGGSVSQNCPDWASAKNMDELGNDVCALPSTIVENRTLTNDIVWHLNSRVTVGNGNGIMSPVAGTLESDAEVINATLTIQEGTHIKASKGTFANLLITRGSKIEAVGTASDPIVFSSDDEGYDGAGEWGGLIIHGYGLHNNANYSCDAGTCQNVDSEGESGFSGGEDAADDSGTLKYVVVAEGGYEFAPGNEINGISFVAVGSGTEVDFVQVHGNADDGVEFYGGSVNAKHLVLTNNLDDSVDWDEGYQGNMQHVLVKQSADAEGNAIEADTEGSLDFYSKPMIANATFIGHGEKEKLLVFKKNSGGFMSHSVLTSFDASVVTDCIDAASTDQVGASLAFENIVADCPVSGELTLLPAVIADVSLDANYASEAPQAIAVGDLDIAAFNGRNALSVADVNFFDAADYAGAVNPDGSDLWFEGWTVEGSL